MVKKKLGGSKTHKGPKAATGRAVQTPDQDGPEPPGHVKKRLTKKLHFLERVADSKHKALAATAGIKKKPHKSKLRQQKALPDLSSLGELLADVDQKQQKQASEQHGNVQTNKQKGRTEQINGSKARRNVTQVETQRMQQVLAHPEFQANPLAAIKNHLAATLPEPAPAKVQPKPKTPQQRRQHKKAKQCSSMDET